MRLGLSLGTTLLGSPGDAGAAAAIAWSAADAGYSVAAAFDMTTLNASMLLLPNFTAAPWVSTASAGTSAGKDMVANLGIATAPVAGTPVGLYTPAHFDGASMLQVSPASDVVASVATSFACLFYADSAATAAPDGQPYLDPALLADGGASFAFAFSSAGFRVGHYLGTWHDIKIPCEPGSWHLAQAQWGAVLRARIDDGDWTPVVTTILDGPSLAARMGLSYGATYFAGDVMMMAASKTTWTDADFDNIRAYCNSIPGVSV